ncbi:hypothetical protein QTP88_017397 [Uroleucon formosanum]
MDWDHNYALPRCILEEVVNVFDDSVFVPITENQVEQVEEDLDDSNFDPDLTLITKLQDNQLIEAAKKKKNFSPAYKKAVLEAKSELKNVNAKPNNQTVLLHALLGVKISRRQFLAKCITITSVKRRKTVEGSVDSFKKSQPRVYKLPDSKKNEVQVCKTTLLNVLGYTNDSVLTELVKNMNSNFYMSSVTENRGQQNIKKNIPKDIVADHIRLYKPSVSHYQRLDAPNIKYLPFGLTVKAMYDDFRSQHKNYCSQEFYRQVIKNLNISLRNPTIDKYNITLLENHKAKALTETSKYKEDSKLNIESTCIYSMDLQKVILIPNMPDTKSYFFTSRLVVFNETFAQLKPNALCHCVLWHEAIAGQLKDFCEWKNEKRITNVKTDTLYGFKMNSVVMAKFSRRSTCMEYWTDFNGEGINLNKKKGIIDKLVPVMPENRKHFWINLPVSVTSEDLVDEVSLGNAFITSDYE